MIQWCIQEFGGAVMWLKIIAWEAALRTEFILASLSYFPLFYRLASIMIGQLGNQNWVGRIEKLVEGERGGPCLLQIWMVGGGGKGKERKASRSRHEV